MLRIFGTSLAFVTTLAAIGYAWFMVVWMHAPAVQVVALTVVLSIPALLIAWGAFRLARRLAKTT